MPATAMPNHAMAPTTAPSGATANVQGSSAGPGAPLNDHSTHSGASATAGGGGGGGESKSSSGGQPQGGLQGGSNLAHCA